MRPSPESPPASQRHNAAKGIFLLGTLPLVLRQTRLYDDGQIANFSSRAICRHGSLVRSPSAPSTSTLPSENPRASHSPELSNAIAVGFPALRPEGSAQDDAPSLPNTRPAILFDRRQSLATSCVHHQQNILRRHDGRTGEIPIGLAFGIEHILQRVCMSEW